MVKTALILPRNGPARKDPLISTLSRVPVRLSLVPPQALRQTIRS